MNEAAVIKATGRSLTDWFDVIKSSEQADAPHKEIASFLHAAQEVSFWWAQQITVEYEKYIGRRILGQTENGLFQIGVSKTISASAAEVWQSLTSPAILARLIGDTEIDNGDQPRTVFSPAAGSPTAGSPAAGSEMLRALDTDSSDSPPVDGIIARTTTYKEGSHVRMRWRKPDWPEHSILQIRVTPKGEGKSTLSFHQEKLPSQDEREKMRMRWMALAEQISRIGS